MEPNPRILKHLSLAALGATILGCSQPQVETPAEDLLAGEPFVPVYRDRTSDMIEARRAALSTADVDPTANHHFYLAIRKSELGQRWFLHAYFTQIHPGGVTGGAGRSISTRVVSFKVQNGKLFLFDVADDKAWSDTFRPEVVLEAYPIVQGFSPFDRLRGAADYVLFDPSAGLNRFSLLGDQSSTVAVKVELTFSQRFRKIPDGATFDQVFTGTGASGLVSTSNGSVIQLPPARIAGTFTIGLRRYAEGEGYVPTPLPPVEHYFRSPAKQVINEGRTVQTAAKWNLKPGGKPITWAISGLAESLRKQPQLAEFDFAGAIRQGIESWNEAFGWKALETRMARPDESIGDDDVNHFIFDADLSYSAAFANWRSNPNNGEIRGASVYFPLARVRSEIAPTPPVPVAEEFTVGPATSHRPSPGLAWGDALPHSLCDLELPSMQELLEADVSGLTRKERMERYVAFISAHEIGHTLGLRHNFKGSLRPLTSSVMEYVTAEDAMVLGGKVGSYDVAAIRYLYGLAPQLPQDPFCTDDQVATDPDCRQRDRGSNPLADWVIPQHKAVEPFLAGQTNSIITSGMDGLVQYVRLGTPAARTQAFMALFAPIKVPVTRPMTAPPDFGPRVDFITRLTLQRLFNLTSTTLPPTLSLPQPGLSLVIPELEGNLTNADGLRSFPNRRLAADILKRLQNAPAHAALIRAREAVATQLALGVSALETKDLLNRIDRHLGGYYD